MLLDVVILPPWMLRNRLGKKITRAASNSPCCVFVVDNKKLIPHLSLFHLRISKSKLKKLGHVVQKITKKFTPFKLKSVEFVKYRKDLVLYFRISKPTVLSRLNQVVVESCRGFREGELFLWYKNHPFPKLDRMYINKFGTYWSTGKNFNPHLTVVKYKNPSDKAKIMGEMRDFRFEFAADTIAICEINKYGQVIKILKTFKLHG